MFIVDKYGVVKNIVKKSKDQKILDRVNNYHYSTRKPVWPWIILAVFLTTMSLFVR